MKIKFDIHSIMISYTYFTLFLNYIFLICLKIDVLLSVFVLNSQTNSKYVQHFLLIFCLNKLQHCKKIKYWQTLFYSYFFNFKTRA